MIRSLLSVLIAGLFFGAWPLLMNESGLKGYTYSAVYCVMVSSVLIPVALLGDKSSLGVVAWKFVILAGIAGAIGLIAFGDLASRVTKEQFNSLFIITMVVQCCVPAAYDLILTKQLTWQKGLGFIAAIIAIFCLTFQSSEKTLNGN